MNRSIFYCPSCEAGIKLPGPVHPIVGEPAQVNAAGGPSSFTSCSQPSLQTYCSIFFEAVCFILPHSSLRTKVFFNLTRMVCTEVQLATRR